MIRLSDSLTVLLGGCGLLLLFGCSTLFSPLAPGLEMEEAGDYPEAAEVYLGLLEEYPTLAEARARLREVGPLAMDIYLHRAFDAGEEGDYTGAMRHVDHAERLRREAGAAGVVLELPDTLAAFRDEAATRAVDRLRRRAETAEQEGAWMGAKESYLRALHYAPPEQHRELHDAIHDLHLRWAEAHLAEGRFADAYGRIQYVLEMLEQHDPRRDDAGRLYNAALEAASVRVALMPLGVSDDLAEHLPERLRIEIHEALDERFWHDAPRFINGVSRDAQRRELRRLRYDQHRIHHRQAMELGRVLRADLVVLTEIVDFRRVETDREEEQRPARFLDSITSEPDTAYTAEHVTVELEVEVAYRTIAPTFGLVLGEGTVRASGAHPIQRAVFKGSTHNLALTDEERELFDLEAIARQERIATEALIDSLVEQLTERLHQESMAGETRAPVLSGN